MASDKSKLECSSLPKGWTREVVLRKNGASAGKSDVYYYSPEGRKFRSKPQISQYFGESLDLSNFDFRSGRFDASFKNKKRARDKVNEINFGKDFLRPSTVCPKRITKRSMDKSLVKHIRASLSGDSEVSNSEPEKGVIRKTRALEKAEAEIELKRAQIRESSLIKERHKPRQLFWHKRLQGLNAVDRNTKKQPKPFKLPVEIRSLSPAGDETELLRGIMSCLHSNTKVIGQNMSLNALKKNPGTWCNPDQPFCPPFVITTDMIKEQERKVESARRELADALEVLRYIEEDDFENE